MARVAAGEVFSSAERLTIDKAIRRAEQACRFEFSVYAGPAEGDDTRAFAERLHQRLVAPDRSVLVLVDPARRVVEVVTGEAVRRRVTDAQVELAMMGMQSEFAQGNLCAGVVRGVDQLAAHAHRG